MRCPYCSNPAVEEQEECPRCGFALHKLEGWFGAIPRLVPGLSDNAALFTAGEQHRLRTAIARFRKAFPQLSFHIVTANLNAGDNLTLYTFWIFNRSGICNDMAPGGDNRNVLMIIDAFNGRLCLTAGYGLEPFLGERHLAKAGAAAAPGFHAGRWLEGARAALDATTAALIEIHDHLDDTYGIDSNEIALEERARDSALAIAGDEDSPY